MTPITTPDDFRIAFLKAYDEALQRTKPVWHTIWKSPSEWTHFMLYDGQAVLKMTADHLGLEYCPWVSEPLRLDAALVPGGAKHWFPMHVAVEHENEPNGFEGEICKLLSVRAPLKVGITYALSDHKKHEEIPGKIRDMISNRYAEIAATIGEDRAAQYLFLVGVESDSFQLHWLSLTFRAGDGLRHTAFA
jgi:hypothetical protein